MSDAPHNPNGAISLTIASDKRELELALQRTTDLVRSALTSDELLRFQLAIQELLMNAFEHGNLGISAQEKIALCESGDLEAAHESRSQVARRASKTIRVKATLEGGVFRCSIEDDGAGFDWEDAQERSQKGMDLLAPSGRGLSIINATFDAVQFNTIGNCVTVLKDLSKKS